MQRSIIYLISLTFLISCSGEKPQKARPNVLFILADDFGYHDTGIMGSSYYDTPHIDSIALNGMIFENGYAACQVCSPSRAAIMTGKYPARLRITDWIGARTGEQWRTLNRHNKLLPAANNAQLALEDVSLAEAMKAEGYKTFFAGKWHLGNKGSWPEDHGFDINKGGWEKGSPMGGYYAPWENPNLEAKFEGESLPLRLAEETANFIKTHKDTQFFAFLSFYAVHGPIQTTQKKWKKYQERAAEQGIAEKGFVMERRLPIRQVQDNPVYAGLVESMDDAVGIVRNALKEAGLDKNTIIIFTSDNGGVASGDAYSTSNLPLRGGKGYQWEGGIREPYFISVPWLSHKGSRTQIPAIGMD
ncbi:MAG: sulfatase, partial [Bacteroidota bacterium]